MTTEETPEQEAGCLQGAAEQGWQLCWVQAGSAGTSAGQAQEGSAATTPAAGRHHTLCWALLSSPLPTLCFLRAGAGAAAVELLAGRTVFVSLSLQSQQLAPAPAQGRSQAGAEWD